MARFRSSWRGTLDVLEREMRCLGAELVVIQVNAAEQDIRLDGMLRANARIADPGVRLAFDTKHGHLTYATDVYDRWQDNVRAVALALEALRAVDRYGVSRRGEQYRGWRALPAGTTAASMTVGEAAELLAEHCGGAFTAARLLTDRAAQGTAYRLASRVWHPDLEGGDQAVFERLTAARDLLAAVTT